MKPLAQLVRPNILALQPYSTARDEYAGGGIDVWLDANESPYDNGVNRYPDPHQRALKALIAELKDVDAGRIFLGNGSDEAIDLAYRIFCRPGTDNAVSIAPTYGMYRVAADINDIEMREVPLGEEDRDRDPQLFGLALDHLAHLRDDGGREMGDLGQRGQRVLDHGVSSGRRAALPRVPTPQEACGHGKVRRTDTPKRVAWGGKWAKVARIGAKW